MPQENQRHVSINELLEDIRYVNQSAAIEIQQAENQLRQHIAAANLPANVPDALIDYVSSELGRLTVKVKLTDKALRSLQTKQKSAIKTASTTTTPSVEKMGDLSFKVSELVGVKNLLPVETSPSGIKYCWTGANPETSFSLAVDRSKKLEMQILVFALIKPEYSKQLKVFVDGAHIKHRFSFDGQLYVVSCLLPNSTNTSRTDISIILPDTHCPTDLGGGLDGRTLGIAISGIHFTKPPGLLTRFLRRLHLKR